MVYIIWEHLGSPASAFTPNDNGQQSGRIPRRPVRHRSPLQVRGVPTSTKALQFRPSSQKTCFFSFSPFIGYHFGSSYFHIFSQEQASTQLHAAPSTLSPSSTPPQPAQLPSTELQHRHHPFPTTNHMSSTELHNTARHHPFPTTNQPDVLHRAATPPPFFPDNQPAVFRRAATSPPSFPETITQLSSTELQHRHHPFPRRPASCAFHRAATSPSSFPETTSQLSSTELQHRHHPFPTTTLPVLAAVCVSSLASCYCSSSSSSSTQPSTSST
jgi:hypothetical protein